MAEKKVIELEVKTESFKPLKAQLREAQQAVAELSEKFGATSKEAIQAAKRASELKDAIADAKDLTDAFNPDAKFNALSNSIGGVLNGFQAFEGALGLVGVEGEALQETLLKVQSAMALSQGIQGALEAKDSFKQLGAVVGDAFGKMTTAGKAFALTGIGLVITAIGTAIAYWDDLKVALGAATDKQNAYNETLDAYKEGATEAIKQTTEVKNSFDLARQGVISKEEALHVYNSTLGDTFGKAKNLNEAEKLYNDKTQAYIKATALRAQAQALFAKAADEQVKALTAEYEDQTGVVDKAKAGIYAYFGGVKQGADELIKAQKEGTAQTKKTSEARAKTFNDLAADLLKEAELIEKKNKIVSKNEKDTADEIAAAKKAATKKAVEQKIEETRKLGEVTQEQEDFFMSILTDADAEKKKLDDDRIAKQEEEELMLMQFKGDLYKQDVDNYDEAEAKKKKLREDNLKSGLEQTKKVFDLVASIAESNAGEDEERQRKAFNLRKAANIATATIDGYKAVLSTYADTPGGPVIKGVAAAIAGAFALLQISNIAKGEFKSNSSGGNLSTPSGGGGGGTTSPSVISPNFNIVGNAQATNPLAGLGNQPLQAYVVSGEVTTAQSLDRNRINYATFG
jgi:hypothetical protein